MSHVSFMQLRYWFDTMHTTDWVVKIK